MQANRGRDTAPEMALRSELHRRGFRYRKHFRPVEGLRRTADIAFTRHQIAVFVDGCFWHVCPIHGTMPVVNRDFWEAKLERNRERDRETDVRLTAAGWKVIRVWEHESVNVAADRVARIVTETAWELASAGRAGE